MIKLTKSYKNDKMKKIIKMTKKYKNNGKW
jgi:hypothetical protein